MTPRQAVGADEAGDGLDGDVADAEEQAGGGGEHDAVVLTGGADRRADDEQRAEAEEDELEGDERRRREGRVRALGARQRDDEEDQAQRREGEAPPLTRRGLQAEHAVGHHGEHRDAAGEDGLDDGERGEADRRDVQHPGAGAEEHADGEPLRRPQRPGGAERVLDVHRARLARAAVLEEERHVRGEGAHEREQDAELESHSGGGNDRDRGNMRCPAAIRAIGTTPRTLDGAALTNTVAGRIEPVSGRVRIVTECPQITQNRCSSSTSTG
jgi:hypothetical protein